MNLKKVKCKGCFAEMAWVETNKGKMMPVDWKPLMMMQIKLGIGEMIPVFMPHWATCKEAHRFKKRVKGK